MQMPCAAAVVAVTIPGRPLTIAWAGDCRAYLLRRGIAVQLTRDHNMRRVDPPTELFPYGGNRNRITSCLGATATDEECMDHYSHPAIESVTEPLDGVWRLVLASDGAYEPHHDADSDPYMWLEHDDPTTAAREFVDLAVKQARAKLPPEDHCFVDNATVLVADLP